MSRSIGPYRIRGLLGQGGMGRVYEVEDPALPGRRLALKVVHQPAAGVAARIRREAELLARVAHPGVVRVHAAGEAPEGPFLVMDLVEGQPLDRLLRERGPFAPARAAELTLALAEAVAALHAAGLLHRDLKPQNVLLRPDGSPVLVDFGLAWAEDVERLTRTGALVGTPLFMAPEQLAARPEPPDARSDVWGLGTILHTLLAGQGPFEDSRSLPEALQRICQEQPAWPAAPAPLLRVLRRALAKRPAERHPDARALADDLRRARAELDRAVAGARRLALVAGALLLGAALAAAFAARGALRAPAPAPAPPAADARRPEPAGPRPPCDPRQLQALLARDDPEAVLAALEGEPDPGPRWRELAGALLCVEDAGRVEPWAARIAALPPEGRALVATVVSARRGAPLSATRDPDGAAAAVLRLEARLAELRRSEIPTEALRLQDLAEAARAPAPGPWLQPALALRAQRGVVERLFAAASLGKDLPRAESHAALVALARGVERSRWAAGLELLELFFDRLRARPDAQLAPRAADDPSWGQALGRLPEPLRETCLVTLEALRLWTPPLAGEVESPTRVAEGLARVREVRRRAQALGLVDAEGTPVTEDGTPLDVVFLARPRLFVNLLLRELDLLAWEGWHHRDDPARREGALARSLPLLAARRRSDPAGAPHYEARALLWQDRPDEALGALPAEPARLGPWMAVATVQAALAARPAGDELLRQAELLVAPPGFAASASLRAQRLRLRALVAAAGGDAQGARAALTEAEGVVSDEAPFLPWLAPEGAARQVELLLQGVPPREALRRVVSGE